MAGQSRIACGRRIEGGEGSSVGLAEQYGARLRQLVDQGGVASGAPAGVKRRTVGRGKIARFVNVFGAERKTEEWTVGGRRVGSDGCPGMYLRIEFGDSVQAQGLKIVRSQLPGFESGDIFSDQTTLCY